MITLKIKTSVYMASLDNKNDPLYPLLTKLAALDVKQRGQWSIYKVASDDLFQTIVDVPTAVFIDRNDEKKFGDDVISLSGYQYSVVVQDRGGMTPLYMPRSAKVDENGESTGQKTWQEYVDENNLSQKELLLGGFVVGSFTDLEVAEKLLGDGFKLLNNHDMRDDKIWPNPLK